MLKPILAILGVFLVLVVSEILWRKKTISGEYARKFVHILAGVWVAFWPQLISFKWIMLISALAFMTLLLSRKFKIFHAVHDIRRLSIGELLYPLGVLVSAALASSAWIFTVAVLFVALADGMAALIGKKYGKDYGINFWGSKKTLAGSCAYLTFSYVSLLVGILLGGVDALRAAPIIMLVWLPPMATLLEAFSPWGLDNLTTPLVVVLVLNLIY